LQNLHSLALLDLPAAGSQLNLELPVILTLDLKSRSIPESSSPLLLVQIKLLLLSFLFLLPLLLSLLSPLLQPNRLTALCRW
jgi:hypothetical protein